MTAAATRDGHLSILGGVTNAAEEEQEDGRRARRDRNREAVVDAYLELVREGDMHPSVADVAERSGVSHRSVFRYFADKDELARTAVQRQLAWASSLAPIPVEVTAPLDQRIAALVERRAAMFERIGLVGRLSRALAGRQPIIAEQLELSRRFFRKQVKTLFERELAALGEPEAGEALGAIDVLCSFEAYDLLRRDQGMSQARAMRTMERAVTVSLTHR
jgi:TetR/AcrR family transcriptional regulator, regulator of autoinduction and epiphytic fitness